MAGLEPWGVGGLIVAVVLPLVRMALVAVIALWSLKADKAGRTHALALIRALKLSLPFKRRPR